MAGRKPMETNALIITAQGLIQEVYVDFSDYESMCSVIDAEAVDRLHTSSTLALSEECGVYIQGFVDRKGMEKELDENEIGAIFSGYSVIFGDVVVCGCNSSYDYIGLNPEDLKKVGDIIKKRCYILGYPW